MNFLHNGLIAQLTPANQALLLRKSKLIRFGEGELLGMSDLHKHQILFITSGTVALFACTKMNDLNSGLAVGLVGAEGALGVQMALGLGSGNLSLIAQSPGEAYAIESDIAIKLVRRKSDVLLTFAKYIWNQLEAVAQHAAMSHVQDIRLRLANWLLLSAKLSAPEPLFLTHSQIAKMLGVRRVSISLEANKMKKMGFIDYSRGRIQLKNIEALRQLADGSF